MPIHGRTSAFSVLLAGHEACVQAYGRHYPIVQQPAMPDIKRTQSKAMCTSVAMTHCNGDPSIVHHQTHHHQSLEALHPMPVLPEREASKRARSFDFLRRIEHVHVRRSNRRDATNAFCIDIYFHDAHSNIPVHSPQCLPGGANLRSEITSKWIGQREPSLQVEHSFADFVEMREYFYWLARTGHDCGLCSFCKTMISVHVNGKAKPRWNSTWFKTAQGQSELLTTYLEELVETVRMAPMCALSQCEGQFYIPRVLARFLKQTYRRESE